MKKRIIAAIMAMALGGCLLAGCGGQESRQSEAPAVTEEAASPEMEADENAVAGPEAPEDQAKPEDGAAAEAINQQSASRVSEGIRKVGMLSMLRSGPEGMNAVATARMTGLSVLYKEGYVWFPFQFDIQSAAKSGQVEVKFYDSLTEMQMALMSGDIDLMNCYTSVADYLHLMNENLVSLYKYDTNKDRNAFADLMFSGLLGNDFSFLLMEDRTELRDQINEAIRSMKSDGTMDKLIKEQITDAVNGKEPLTVDLSSLEGDETIRVAVTGSLPPMDYVTAQGEPSGFNTAVLYEVGKRINKKIELVIVDSVGRATALASGNVDAVFWTRTSARSMEATELSEEEREAKFEEKKKEMSEEELAAINYIDSIMDVLAYGTLDIPDRTIITDPYYSDLVTVVLTKEKMDSIMAASAQ